ncbi:MAG: alpha/beta hydrolase [Acidobacteria bacterium]|nr:alpha/beta hydrolase [Acidobacteriota bacterium]
MATNLRGVRRGYADIGDGLQMYYETMGEGEPLILLHQSWWNSFEFEGVIPLLAARYKVYAFDTLGFGFSPAAPEWWEFSEFTDSVVHAMDSLGIEKAHFGGMHTGALIMADLDARHKERCGSMCYGGLAIYDEALRMKKYSFRRMIGQNQAPYVKVLQPGDVIGHEGALLQRKADGSHMIEYWMEQVRENPDSKLEYIQRAMMANMLHYDKGGADALTVLLGFNLKRALKFCTRPSLHLIGSRDVVKKPIFETIVQAASYQKSAIKRFKVIYGAGIMAWLDYPQEYAQACLEFLANPAAYVGTTGHELDLAMNEYLLMVPGEAQFQDYNRYPDSKPAPARTPRPKARR